MKNLFQIILIMLAIGWEAFGDFSKWFVGCLALDVEPVPDPPPEPPIVPEPEKSWDDQLKELLPQIANFKDILGDASKDHKSVKDLTDKLKNLEGSITNLSEKVIKLGKKDLAVKSTGWDTEMKTDCVKFFCSIGKLQKGYANPEKHIQAVKEVQDKYLSYGKSPDLNIGTDADGGYLIPEPFRDQIWRVAEAASIALQMATVAPLTRGNKIPVLSVDTANAAFWTAEAAALTQSDPTFAKDEQAAEKLAAYSVMSNELLEDEEVGLADLLVTLFGESMAIKIDAQFFNGTGAGVATQQPFTGIMQKTGINTVTMTGSTFASVNFDDLTDAITQLKSSVKMNARFAMHRTIENVLKKVKDASDLYIWGPASQGSPATMWGWPYSLSDQMPALTDTAANTPFIIFGNMKNVLIGTKGEMTVRVTDIPKILNDQTIMVVRRRLAIVVALPAGFSVIKTAASS